MPSKGITCYSWVGTPQNYTVRFAVPNGGSLGNDAGSEFRSWGQHHLEVDSAYMDSGLYTGSFNWIVFDSKGNVAATKWNNIDSFNGNLEADSQMVDLASTQSIITSDLVITYGFYNAGSGWGGLLPSSDLCWVTVTQNRRSWMNMLAPPGSPQAKKKLTSMVLPSPHKAGMNTVDNFVPLANRLDPYSSYDHVVFAGFDPSSAQIIAARYMTQKDTIPSMLSIGAR